MTVQLIRAEGLWDGVPYAYASAAPTGSLVFTAGSGLPRVLKTTIYVASADRADLVAAWEVIRAAFGDHDAPGTLLGDRGESAQRR